MPARFGKKRDEGWEPVSQGEADVSGAGVALLLVCCVRATGGSTCAMRNHLVRLNVYVEPGAHCRGRAQAGAAGDAGRRKLQACRSPHGLGLRCKMDEEGSEGVSARSLLINAILVWTPSGTGGSC